MKNLLVMCLLDEESQKKMIRADNLNMKNLIFLLDMGGLIIFLNGPRNGKDTNQ